MKGPSWGLIVALALAGVVHAADKSADKYTKWKKAVIAAEIETIQKSIDAVTADKNLSATERNKRANSLRARIASLKKTSTAVPEIGHIGEEGVGKLINPKATVIEVVGSQEVIVNLEFTITTKAHKNAASSFYVYGGTRPEYRVAIRGMDTTTMTPGMIVTLPEVVKIKEGGERSQYTIEPWQP
jgi:hypothetical protein